VGALTSCTTRPLPPVSDAICVWYGFPAASIARALLSSGILGSPGLKGDTMPVWSWGSVNDEAFTEPWRLNRVRIVEMNSFIVGLAE